MQLRTEITEKGAALAIVGIIVDTITEVGMISEEPNLKDLLMPGTPASRFVLEGIELAIGACLASSLSSSKRWWLGRILQTMSEHLMSIHRSSRFSLTVPLAVRYPF